jgi:hypothetical protein
MDRDRDFKTLALTEVNRHILEAVQDSNSNEYEWEFFCVCGREDCDEHVSLSLDAYEALRDSDGAVLAPGHRLSQTQRARRLQEESAALRAQAQHQVERARRNIRSAPSPTVLPAVTPDPRTTLLRDWLFTIATLTGAALFLIAVWLIRVNV